MKNFRHLGNYTHVTFYPRKVINLNIVTKNLSKVDEEISEGNMLLLHDSGLKPILVQCNISIPLENVRKPMVF